MDLIYACTFLTTTLFKSKLTADTPPREMSPHADAEVYVHNDSYIIAGATIAQYFVLYIRVLSRK